MKKNKQRVIAIDYFKGICILAVLINHAYPFSKPFAYFAGDGGLWVSAAELFLMLSGLTFAIVRGPEILSDFRSILKKTWRRALIIYAVKTLIGLISLITALWLVTHNLNNDVSGSLPTTSGLNLMWSILNSSYSIGWANFLMYYSVFLIFAPFTMYILRTRYWATVPVLSVAILIMTHPNSSSNVYYSFGFWQVYFVIGMLIGRFRHHTIELKNGLRALFIRSVKLVIISVAATILSISALLDLPIYPIVAHLTNGGWLPVKLQSAYIVLRSQKPMLDNLLMNSRTGVLRPLAALIVFAAAYFLFVRYKELILKYTGSFVITMGRNTMMVFVAQALAIPLIGAINLPRTLLMNTFLTGFLVLTMWLVAKQEISRQAMASYLAGLKETYNAGKYTYLRRYADD